nr:hypothetical protein [Tanacetum cinerariifolium]
ASGRSSTGSGKLPEEAQPHEARHGIRMQYLPTTIWRRGDKERAAAMIQAIDKMLKTRRILRSLEKFVGGRLYDKKEKSEKLGRVPTEMELILEHTQQAAQGNAQSWISTLAKQTDARSSFNELLDTPIDFSNFIMNRLGVDTLTPKLLRRREDDDQEGPFAGSDRGSKRQKERGEHASASTLSEKATEGAGRSTTWSQSRQMSTSESAFTEEPVQNTCQKEEPPHPVFETGADDQPIVQTSQHPEWFSQPRRPPSPDRDWTKTLPAAQGDAQSWIRDLAREGGASSRKYTTSVTKTKAADYGHIKWIEDLVPRAMWIQQPIDYNRHALWGVSQWGWKRKQFYGYAVNRESALDVYSKRRIIDVTELKIVEWHDYKHLDWIFVRRDDDQIYKFKECDFKRLRLQGIEDMLLLLVQGKLSNLTIEERLAFNVSLRMFTRSIVIQRRVEDLQLGVESYQKRLNLTKLDTYRTNLRRHEAYTTYSNPRGFIYQNKDKKNRLMRIDELHKFSDETLNDVRNTLDDHLKGIRMQYLPTTIWRRGDKDKAAAMIQAIKKMLKTRRILRSLEKFVGGRLYEGDFHMLQRTI